MSLRASEQQELQPNVKTLIAESDVNGSAAISAIAAIKAKPNPKPLLAQRPKDLTTHSALSSDVCSSRSFKLKSIKEKQNNSTNLESITKLSSEERVIWKNAKIFSKTLASIEGKKTKGENFLQMSSTAREYSGTDLCHKNSEPNVIASSLKRPSGHSSGAGGPAAKPSEWKLLKSKLSLLRKKGNKEMVGNANDNTFMGKDIKDVNISGNTGSSGSSGSVGSVGKQEKPSGVPALPSIPATESILIRKGWSQEKGIICKKEDLMHIISEASKGVKVMKPKSAANTDDEVRQQLCATASTASTTSSASSTNSASADADGSADVFIKRITLKKQHSCGSQSSCDREENNTTKQSNTRTECYDSSQPENSHKNQYKTYDTNTTEVSVSENFENNQNFDRKESNANESESEIRLKNKNKSTISSELLAISSTNLANTQTDNNAYNDGNSVEDKLQDNDPESSVRAVQWDDINFVDPCLLGDAIQSFLQGLGSSSVGNTSNEKRVSFKKNF